MWGPGLYKCGSLVYTNVGPWSIQMWVLGPYKCGSLVYTNVGPWSIQMCGTGPYKCGALVYTNVGPWSIQCETIVLAFTLFLFHFALFRRTIKNGYQNVGAINVWGHVWPNGQHL